MRTPRSIAITGLRSFVGKRLLRRVREAEPDAQLVGIDLQRPYGLDPAVRFHAVDLAEPTADGRLAELLRKEGVEALLHAAFRSQPRADLEADHELETIGSLHVLHACAAAGVRRLVLASSTMLPPSPPLPPEGPPSGRNFSRRNATQPSPPLPASTSIATSSTKCTALLWRSCAHSASPPPSAVGGSARVINCGA